LHRPNPFWTRRDAGILLSAASGDRFARDLAMFDTLRRFVSEIVGDDRAAAPSGEEETEIAVAALLAFIVVADGELDDADRVMLADVLARNFNLDADAARDLVEAGVSEEEQAVDFYTFTSRLNRTLDEEGRRKVVRMMWETVFADGKAQELEDNIVWRVADLLGVSDRERIELKLSTQAQLRHAD
jgi:uncharacterized tellurite resistance protein B-like protein